MENYTHSLALDSKGMTLRPLHETGRVLCTNETDMNVLVRSLNEDLGQGTATNGGRNFGMGHRGPHVNDDGAWPAWSVCCFVGGRKSTSKIWGEVRLGEGATVTSICKGFGLNSGCELGSPMLATTRQMSWGILLPLLQYRMAPARPSGQLG